MSRNESAKGASEEQADASCPADDRILFTLDPRFNFLINDLYNSINEVSCLLEAEIEKADIPRCRELMHRLKGLAQTFRIEPLYPFFRDWHAHIEKNERDQAVSVAVKAIYLARRIRFSEG